MEGSTPFTGWPASRTSPTQGVTWPANTFSAVVLPQPEGPTRATNSPFSTERLNWSRATRSGRFLEREKRTETLVSSNKAMGGPPFRGGKAKYIHYMESGGHCQPTTLLAWVKFSSCFLILYKV